MAETFSKNSQPQRPDRHLIISHPYGGVRQIAIGTYTRLCAFCGGKVVRMRDISYTCFSCGRRYDDFADTIDSLIIENENITIEEIADTLKVEEKIISIYLTQNNIHLNSGDANRACVYCGRGIEKGNWCGQCDMKVPSSDSSKKLPKSWEQPVEDDPNKPKHTLNAKMHFIGTRK